MGRRDHKTDGIMTGAITMKNATVAIDGSTILRGLTLGASPGEFIAIIGPNGAGKSTMLRAAAGLLSVDDGAVKIDGSEITALTPIERARRLSYLPQSRPVYWAMPVRAIVALGRFAYGDGDGLAAKSVAVESAMEEAGVTHLADRSAAALSGGELARVHFARALAGETPILIADEPTTALDPAHQLSVMSLLHQKAAHGRLVIAALHDLDLAARYATRIVILNNGTIVGDGPPAQAITPAMLRDVFNVCGEFSTNDKGTKLSLAPL